MFGDLLASEVFLTPMTGNPRTDLVIWGTVLLAALGALTVLVGKLRDRNSDEEPQASELLTKFKEIYAQGGLSSKEYRTIKTKLADELQDELRDSDETG